MTHTFTYFIFFFLPLLSFLRRPEIPVLKQEKSDFLDNAPHTQFAAYKKPPFTQAPGARRGRAPRGEHHGALTHPRHPFGTDGRAKITLLFAALHILKARRMVVLKSSTSA